VIEILITLFICFSAAKIVKDYNRKLIKTTTMFTYEMLFLATIYAVLNKDALQNIASMLGFKVASNLVLLVLIIIGLIANYITQTKVRILEMQIVALSRHIALSRGKIED
jgi:hypothetical protein